MSKSKLIVYSILGILSVFNLFSCSSNKDSLTGSKLPRVTVYFTQASDDLGVVLIPVLRNVPEDRSAYETAMKELFLGPTIEEQEKLKLRTEVPSGSRLIKVQEDSKRVNIDISSQFMEGGGSESMQVRFRQLRETALNLAKGRPVYLYMDGLEVKKIGGEGYEVNQPIGKLE
jgi:spore germination protein GerM